jgi:hypothetical protein
MSDKIMEHIGLSVLCAGAAGMGLSTLFNAAAGTAAALSLPIAAIVVAAVATSIILTGINLHAAFRYWSKRREKQNENNKTSPKPSF